jgi:hypothetical protein
MASFSMQRDVPAPAETIFAVLGIGIAALPDGIAGESERRAAANA